MSEETQISTLTDTEIEYRKYVISIEKDPFSLSLCLLKECPPIVSCNKELFQFNGKCYELISDEFLLQLYNNFIRDFGIVKAWPRRNDVIASFRVLREIPHITAFNDYKSLMCIENGILDTSTRTLAPHSPHLYFDSCINVSYDTENKESCPVFMNYLDDVFNGDEDTINNIIRIGGYLLDTSCKAGKMFLFNGGGGSGKSTLINVFSMFFHRSSDNSNQVTAMSLEELASGSFDKEDLINSRVNLAAETKKGYVDAEEIKKIVTGDLIKVSRKYGRAITFVPKTKLVVACNGLPKFTDTSDGIFRRLVLVDFPNQYRSDEEIEMYGLNRDLGYKTVDFNLEEKLRKEKNAIFNVFLDGLSALKADHYQFIITKKFINMIKEFRKDSDTSREFFEEMYQYDPDAEICLNDIYIHFKKWYSSNVADGSFKFRSAEIAKRIKEIYGITFHRRDVVKNSEGEYEKPYMYHLKRIIHKKDDGFQEALELIDNNET
jgi:putative DNA primase/helicase